LGNDYLLGGDGRDTAVFNIASTRVTKLVRHPDETGYIIQSAEGIDNLESIEILKFTDREIAADTAFQEFATPPTNYANSISSIQSVGITPDGLSLIIKINGVLSSVLRGENLVFTDRSLSTEDLIDIKEDVPVFLSNSDSSGYALGEIFTGPASLGLQYQLIETADNAVVIGSTANEFIKVSSTNSSGKAVDGGGGSDVIDGGVGSTFVSGGSGIDGTPNHARTTFFLDGRAPGTSWSTITDYLIGSDKVTIWGWKQGVSKVSTAFSNYNYGGAEGYEGLTLHFENLLPDNAAPGQTNSNLNSITLSGLMLEDFGASSLAELNTQIANKTSNYFQTGIVSDQFGDHGYLFFS
jgi:Ca2+-binding RTX toxin-like protein